METATKNKKGRPAKFTALHYNLFSEMEKRPAQNIYYAGRIVILAKQKQGDFFVTERGSFRRQGIAEQLGRIYEAGLATDAEILELLEQCIKEYNSGATVKEIEKRLRDTRQILTQANSF